MDENLKKALELDRNDSLSRFKNYFAANKNEIYLDGNSLGKLPRKTVQAASDLVENQWGNRLIRSWNEHWMELPNTIAKKIAKIVGAQADEIFVGDSTSLNLYKLVFAALKLNAGKQKIISDSLNFPTDLYVLQGILKNHFPQHNLQLVDSTDGMTTSTDSFAKNIDKNTALITLSYVTYKSAFKYDMVAVNDLAEKNGSLVIWDLSHAAGAVPIALNESNCHMAAGCTYKYLNGGPGAPAFLYVKKELQEKLENPIWSWFSHEKPFDFNPEYKAATGIQKFAIGTPSILSLAAVEPGLDVLLEAGIENLREKSVRQSTFLIALIQEYLLPFGFQIATPLDEKIRGSHVSLQHEEGYRITRAMMEPKNNSKIIIPDFRPPNTIRLGIAPLYNSFEDLYETVLRIKFIVETREYENFGQEKLTVT